MTGDGLGDLASSPALFPVQDRGGEVQLVRLDEAAYARASFLDERVMAEAPVAGPRSWAEVDAAARGLGLRADFIFHIGHVGSTLMARLLGEHPAVFSLREPGLLRPLADAWPDPAAEARADLLLRLFSRTWRPEQTALIKATSFVSELADDLLSRDAQARALAMGAAPPSYLRGILGGPASRQEIGLMAPRRLVRLERRLGRHLGGAIAPQSEGEAAAMTWLCETLCLHTAAERHGARVLWLDFDRFLDAPATGLSAAFAHLGAAAEPDFIAALVSGPLMRRYSKGPEHAYDANLRREVQAQADREHGAEVRAGMDWLQRMANAHPEALAALRRAALAARPVAAAPSAG
jgi:hypothetical protein